MGFDDLEAAEQAHKSAGETEKRDDSQDSQNSQANSESSNSQDRQESSKSHESSASQTSSESHESSESQGSSDRQTSSKSSESGDSPESGDSSESEDSPDADPLETPAFEFADAKQSPLYARPAAWQAFEDAVDLDVIRALREAGVRNEAKRELHDAALRVAAEHPEEIADALREAREE